MEEILASIRRIIAEDGEAPSASPPEAKPARGDEVLELTEVVEEDGTVVSIGAGGRKAPAAEPPPPPPPPPAAPAAPFGVESAPPPRAEPEPPPLPLPPMPVDAADRLVSGATAAASVAALSQLTGLGARDQLGSLPLGETGRTLEDLVRELLRPMLKDWLDAHLPQLVERLVQEEIERMSREAQGR